MDYSHYRAIMAGASLVLLFAEIIVFFSLSNRLLAELLEKLFEITRLDHGTLMMNFFGVEINMTTSRRFRLSLACQLAILVWIIVLLFVDGCIMQTRYLSSQDACPLLRSDCFMIDKLVTHEKIDCLPGEMISNSTASNTICYVWIYVEQNAVSVLNQIGICSSVFALASHVFKASCRMSRKWWGLLILILLAITFVTLFIVSFIIELPMSVTAKLLTLALSCLTINVIQLFQFTHSYKCEHSL